MHEAYQPIIDDGRGCFPEDLRVKAPRGALELQSQLPRSSSTPPIPSMVLQALMRCPKLIAKASTGMVEVREQAAQL